MDRLIVSIFHFPLASIFAWVTALAFAGAGIANAIGGANMQAQFRRWGYPAWWNFFTAALELLSAALLVFSETRILGLTLGAVVMIAATATIIRHRETKHLPPCILFAALIGIASALMAVH